MLDVLAAGERSFFGFVIEAPYASRHRDLRAEAAKRGFDVILDPKTHAMATVGGHNPSLGALPWGADRPHRAEDFAGDEGRKRAEEIVNFVIEGGYSQVLGPTHLLRSVNDQWLRIDIETMKHTARLLEGAERRVELIYPLALPMQVLRDPLERRAIVAAMADAHFDALWLRIENFGSDASGDKTAAYIEASRDFGELKVPVIADHAGGLPGLGLLAFGAVGGIAHGITLNEGFNVSHWRTPRKDEKGRGAPSTRTYIPQLDMLLTRDDANAFLNSAPRVKAQFGCRDTHCCPHGIRDMLQRPASHFIHQRSEQVRVLSATPEELRVGRYRNQYVRPISDAIAAAAGLQAIDANLKRKLSERQRTVSRFRRAMGHLAEINPIQDKASPPLTRQERESGRP
jgi:hypothetical protein